MAKLRRAVENRGWGLETLDPLLDVLTLQAGHIRDTHPGPKVRIRTMEDARAAWEANRDIFLRMCQCHIEKPCCRDHALRYEPGTRPWAFWVFDLGLPGRPADELAELKRRGLLDAEERRALRMGRHPDVDE